jgi:hypothetical protein
MSIDIASLGITVDTSGLVSGEQALRALGNTSAVAETTIKNSMKGIEGAAISAGRALSGSISANPQASFVAQVLKGQQAFDALRASVDPAWASSQKFADVQKQVAAAVEAGYTNQSVANSVLEAAASRYMGVATAAERAKQAEEQANAKASGLAAQRSQFDQLRASIDPLYASSMRYETALNQIQAAQTAGIVGEREAAMVADMAATRYLGVGTAVKGAEGAVVGLTEGVALNRIQMLEGMHLMREFGTAAAMGIPPVQALGMEFGRIMTFFQYNDQGVSGTFMALGTAAKSAASAVGSFLGPLGLLSIGLTAVVGIAWVDRFMEGRDHLNEMTTATKDLDAAMKVLDGTTKSVNMSVTEMAGTFGSNSGAASQVFDAQRLIAQMNAQKALLEVAKSTSTLFGSTSAGAVGQGMNAFESKTTAAIHNVTRELGLSDDAAKTLIDDMKALGESKTAQQMVDNAQAARLFLMEAAGGFDKMNPKAETLYETFLNIVLQGSKLSAMDMGASIRAATADAKILQSVMNETAALGNLGRGNGALEYQMRKNHAASINGNQVFDYSQTTGQNNAAGLPYISTATAHTHKLTEAEKAYQQVVKEATGDLGHYQLMLSQVSIAQDNGAITATQAANETAALRQKILESTDAGKFYSQAVQEFQTGMADAIVTGHGLGSMLSDLATKFAEAAAQAALFGSGPLSEGSGGGIFGGLLSSLAGLLGGASSLAPAVSPIPVPRPFASGTSYAPGGLSLVGEQGPELVNLPRGAQVVPSGQTAAALGGGGGEVAVLVTVDGGAIQALVQHVSGNVTASAISAYDKTVLPGSVKRINADPRRRG